MTDMTRKFSLILSSLFLLGAASLSSAVAIAKSSALQEIKTFDGQVMRCESREDLGRMGYQVSSILGEIRPPNLEVRMNIVTLKCADREGIYRFEPASLGARVPNSRDGFVEFSSLELVAYTPDLKVLRSLPIDLRSSSHSLIVQAPASGFAGLLPRNANGNGSRPGIDGSSFHRQSHASRAGRFRDLWVKAFRVRRNIAHRRSTSWKCGHNYRRTSVRTLIFLIE